MRRADSAVVGYVAVRCILRPRPARCARQQLTGPESNARYQAERYLTVAARSFADESPDFGKSGSTIADLIVFERFVTAIAVGLVFAVFALAQVIVFVFTALECQGREFAALVRTVAGGLFPALAAGTKKILAPLFLSDFSRTVGSDYGLCHGLLLQCLQSG